MQKKLFQYLCCPNCKNKLDERKDFLFCSKCGTKYGIKNGIPLLIDYKKMTPHLRRQIRYFEKEKASQSKKYQLEHWQELYVKRFLSNLKDTSLLYDCGSGSGYMAIELAKKGLPVIASDLTYKSVLRIKRIAEKLKIEKNMLFICSLAEEVPLKSNSVSGFISLAVLEHLSKEKETIGEWKRVTKKNGLVFITVPLMFRYVFPLLWIPNFVHDKKIGHLRRYDKDSLKRKFRLPIKKTYYSGHLTKIVSILLQLCGAPHGIVHKFDLLDSKAWRSPLWANNITVVMTNKKNEK